jgi:hypothetical protein
MLRDDADEETGTEPMGEIPTTDVGRLRAFRRKLPFGRAALLVVDARTHIVGLADLSVTGAYLTTRAPVSVGETHLLRLLVLPARVELVLKAEVVRVSQVAGESGDHPRGVAVRFHDVDAGSRERLQSFVLRETRLRPRA